MDEGKPRRGPGMQYGVFICHAYRHSDIYNKLRALLRGASRFTLRNESIPDDMLVRTTSADELRSEIRSRIARSDIVLVLTKPAAQRSPWLQEEIRIAQELGKPIIAITYRSEDRKSRLVMTSATRHVDTWRGDYVIRAIREEVSAQKRGERRKQSAAAREQASEPPAVAPAPLPPPVEPQVPKEVLLGSIRPVPRIQQRTNPIPLPSRLWPSIRD